MRRFVYTPGLEVYIRSTATNTIYDVSNDVISGTVTRKVNAVSEAELVLQNKFGKYTLAFQPMDRIAIFLTRTKRVLSFTGFLDEVPLFQLYPGPVTIKASCTLKLLQNTYFDPGLPFLTTFFGGLGWLWDPKLGQLIDPAHRAGNQDIFGGVAELLLGTKTHDGVLPAIGGWHRDHVHILKMPEAFLKHMGHMLKKTEAEDKADMQALKTRIFNLLSGGGAGTIASTGTVGVPALGSTPGIAGKAFLTWDDVARLAYHHGWRGEHLVEAIAICYAESRFEVDNLHNPGWWGLWQISHRSWPKYSIASLRTAEGNAAAAFKISDGGRTKKGESGWKWWQSYTDTSSPNHFSHYTDQARKAAAKVDSTVSPISGGPAPTPPTTPGVPTSTTVLPPGAIRQGGDQGTDYKGVPGTFVRSPGKGKVTFSGAQTGGPGGGFGKAVYVQITGGPKIYIGHSEPMVVTGDHVKAGTPLVKLVKNSYGGARGIAGWFEIGIANSKSNDPFFHGTGHAPRTLGSDAIEAYLAGTGSVPAVAPSSIAGTGTGTLSPTDLATVIGREAAFWFLQVSTSDVGLSTQLAGKRALANDVSLFNWIQQVLQSSGRDFMSMPNGDFLAFYPDHFGWYGRSPYFRISDIEIIDLTIQMTDRELATHVFVTGPLMGGQQETFLDKWLPNVASVEDQEAFTLFINANQHDFNPDKFLKTYGARPKNVDMSNVRHPLLLWIGAWTEFARQWAAMFQTHATFTFLPELIPGGLVQIDHAPNLHITMYVQEVTHSFNRDTGFTTDAVLIAPASKSSSLGKRNLGPMVISGPR